MSLIGLIFLVLGGLAVLRSHTLALTVLAIAAIFQSASALTIGPANVTPGHFVLMFFGLAVILRGNGFYATLGSMVYPRAGFILLLLTIWAVLSAFLLPRLFAGLVQVMPLNARAGGYIEGPLFPVSSNINQAVYAIGNLLAFALTVGLARSHELIHRMALGMLVACGFHISLAVVDSMTFSAGIPQVLDFIRNADYAQAFQQQIAGMKRMNGSYPEPSVFAGASVGLFAFAFTLWRGGLFTPYSGWVSIAIFLGIMLAFSTTGYVAITIYMIMAYSINLLGAGPGSRSDAESQTRRGIVISLLPIGALVGAIIVAIRPDLLSPVTSIFDDTVANKLTSHSGIERASWNMGGVRVFFETAGMGVGVGSIRTSSFLITMAASTGILGIIGFGAFFMRLFLTVPTTQNAFSDPETATIKSASRSACFGFLLSASLSGATPDLGLLFFIFAGIASAPSLARPSYSA